GGDAGLGVVHLRCAGLRLVGIVLAPVFQQPGEVEGWGLDPWQVGIAAQVTGHRYGQRAVRIAAAKRRAKLPRNADCMTARALSTKSRDGVILTLSTNW